MDSVFSFAIGLLTTAMSLLGFVQQHPELPQETREQVQQVAQQAVTEATKAVNEATSGQNVRPVPTQETTVSAQTTPTNTTTTVVASTTAPTIAPAVTPAPKVNVTATPSSVEYDGTSIISWVATNALSCTLGSSPVLLAVTGSQPVKPTGSSDWANTNITTYSVTCTGTGGSATGNATVTIQPWVPPAGYKVRQDCTFGKAPCTTGPDGLFCSKDSCGG